MAGFKTFLLILYCLLLGFRSHNIDPTQEEPVLAARGVVVKPPYRPLVAHYLKLVEALVEAVVVT